MSAHTIHAAARRSREAALGATAGVRYAVVVGALAASAGVHGALAHEHGASFVAAAIGAGGAAFALAVRPGRIGIAAAALLLAALLVAYGVAGEQLDTVAIGTKAIEAGGMLAAISLVRRPPAETGMTPLPLATIVAFVAALIVMAGHGHHG